MDAALRVCEFCDRLERAFREVRRRTRPMSCFNHDQSIERIVYAVLSHLNEQWGSKPLKEFTQRSLKKYY